MNGQTHQAWMRTRGINLGGSQSERSHILEALQTNERDQLRIERTRKHAPDPISERRIEAKLDALDREEMSLRERLNNISTNPEAFCRSCDEPITLDQAYAAAGRCRACFSLSSTHRERN